MLSLVSELHIDYTVMYHLQRNDYLATKTRFFLVWAFFYIGYYQPNPPLTCLLGIETAQRTIFTLVCPKIGMLKWNGLNTVKIGDKCRMLTFGHG